MDKMDKTGLDLNLNDKQCFAVTSDAKNLIVLAGPGSGKTRVLTHRIAWLLEQGVAPETILAVTFTNKAAGEMKERLSAMLTAWQAKRVTARTFHSVGVLILRSEVEAVAKLLARPGIIATTLDKNSLPVSTGPGLKPNFSIYDTTDQRSVITGILKELNLDAKRFPVGDAAAAISGWKNKGILPGDAQLLEEADADNQTGVWRNIYVVYQSKLLAANACDFDDLILYPMLLFENDIPTLRRYQQRFPFILVDEFQDTNAVQYQLVKMLTDHAEGRLTVVGDEDQAIYRFRGADFTNVQRLQTDRPDHSLVLLEQNYRSKPQIVEAASALIGNNIQRVGKRLWTKLTGVGDAIECLEVSDGDAEAARIANLIGIESKVTGRHGADIAVLYRTNSQSRVLETAFLQAGIPYRLAKGLSFYQRREIKDALAYLKLLYNGDALAFQRIANVPRRGLGPKTIESVMSVTTDLRGWLLEFAAAGERIGGVQAAPSTWRRLAQQYGLSITGGAAQKLWSFAGIFSRLNQLPDPTPRELTEAVIAILRPGIEEAERMENLLELVSIAHQTEGTGITGLETFLESTSLVIDNDDGGNDEDRVTLATLHSAKGLEWPVVFLAGAEDDFCPHKQAKGEGADGIEEERRLFYVGVTVPKKNYTSPRLRVGWSLVNGNGDPGRHSSRRWDCDPYRHYIIARPVRLLRS